MDALTINIYYVDKVKTKQKLLVATYNTVRPNKAYSTSWKIFN